MQHMGSGVICGTPSCATHVCGHLGWRSSAIPVLDKTKKQKKHFFFRTTQNTVPPSCDFSSPRNMNAVWGNIVAMMLAMTWRLSLLPWPCSSCLRLIAINFCSSLLTTRLTALQPGLLLQRLMRCHFIELLFLRCWQVGTRPGDFAAGILR